MPKIQGFSYNFFSARYLLSNSLRLSLLPDMRLNQSLNLQSYVRYLVMLHLFLESDESKSSRKIAEYPQDYCVDVVKRFISFNLLI